MCPLVISIPVGLLELWMVNVIYDKRFNRGDLPTILEILPQSLEQL